jgi:hypothetical protein
MNDAKYIGLDVHQATISVAVFDFAGKLVMEAILETKAETILPFLHGLRGSLHVTFEAGTWLPGYTICSSLTSHEWWPAIRARMPY